jgi:NADPH:quinone reductase-like Zn-dependent oxidoreductase
MFGNIQKGLVLLEYAKPLVYQHFPVPEPKEGELLIKVQASTINPSDKFNIGGQYVKVPLPILGGLEGTGRVVEANGANIQNWVGKRVTFTQVRSSGTWGEYSLSTPDRSF